MSVAAWEITVSRQARSALPNLDNNPLILGALTDPVITVGKKGERGMKNDTDSEFAGNRAALTVLLSDDGGGGAEAWTFPYWTLLLQPWDFEWLVIDCWSEKMIFVHRPTTTRSCAAATQGFSFTKFIHWIGCGRTQHIGFLQQFREIAGFITYPCLNFNLHVCRSNCNAELNSREFSVCVGAGCYSRVFLAPPPPLLLILPYFLLSLSKSCNFLARTRFPRSALLRGRQLIDHEAVEVTVLHVKDICVNCPEKKQNCRFESQLKPRVGLQDWNPIMVQKKCSSSFSPAVGGEDETLFFFFVHLLPPIGYRGEIGREIGFFCYLTRS